MSGLLARPSRLSLSVSQALKPKSVCAMRRCGGVWLGVAPRPSAADFRVLVFPLAGLGLSGIKPFTPRSADLEVVVC
ncbi:MAG: hypothetical protein RMI91_07210 [Gemmatales bacterium]|nr:hypothetical protein [Gemmatales bacterium]MDW7994427.1 hypothetical protein [Gemmatales bacterium]